LLATGLATIDAAEIPDGSLPRATDEPHDAVRASARNAWRAAGRAGGVDRWPS
jgi:hypothetical protein